MAVTVHDVYLEVGERWCFAVSLDWPGWARRARDQAGALEQLARYQGRYAAAVPASASVDDVNIVGTLRGDATTDFGAPATWGPWDEVPAPPWRARRDRDVLAACWRYFDLVAAESGPPLALGPRGGGRHLDAVVDHVREAERTYGRKVGVRVPPRTPWADQRAAILEALESGGEHTWPPAYGVRRIAWHVLDHAWEIQDRRVGV